MSLTFNPLILDGFDLAGGGETTIVTGSTPIVGGTPNSILVNDADTVGEVGPLTDGQLLIGSTGNLPAPASITGTTDQVAVTAGPGSITLSLPQDIAPTSDVQFNSIETANVDFDGVLNIGTVDATVINLGNAASVVNFNGTVNNNNVTNLNVEDQLITLNKNGGLGSASGSGFELEEDATITGYIKTSGDRNSFIFKAPNQTGIATVSPGIAGITIDQDSHDPVTVGTANGLSISGQEISLALADALNPGAISAADFETFSNKANAALDNLASTAVNTDILPDSDDNYDLGGDGLVWSNVYTRTIRETASASPRIRVGLGRLLDSTVQPSIEWEGRTLNANDGTPTLDWATPSSIAVTGSIIPGANDTFNLGADGNVWSVGYFYTIRGETAASGVILPESSRLVDTGGIESVGWNQRILKNAADSLRYDWQNNLIYDDSSVLSILPTARQLVNAAGGVIVDWSNTGFLGLGNNRISDLGAPTLPNDAARKSYVDAAVLPTGDIARTNFTGTNSATNANVTGLLFANTLRSFKALVSVQVVEASNLSDTFELVGVYSPTAGWSISSVSYGDGTDVTFDITSGGQVTYSSPAYTGFTSLTMRFRAEAV